MGVKREKPEDLGLKLRQFEVLQGQGKALTDAGLEITESLEEEVGISMGVGIGGLGCIEKYTKILLEQGPKYQIMTQEVLQLIKNQ